MAVGSLLGYEVGTFAAGLVRSAGLLSGEARLARETADSEPAPVLATLSSS